MGSQLPSPRLEERRYVCLKRNMLLCDPLLSQFCEDCWRVYMQAYYLEKGLMFGWKTRLACIADNIVTVEKFEELLEKWLEGG